MGEFDGQQEGQNGLEYADSTVKAMEYTDNDKMSDEMGTMNDIAHKDPMNDGMAGLQSAIESQEELKSLGNETDLVPGHDEEDLVEISSSRSTSLELLPGSNQLRTLPDSEIPPPLPSFQALVNSTYRLFPLSQLLSFINVFLDPQGASFVHHFEQKVSGALTVSPSTSNYFAKTFLLLATVDEGVGHALASWGALYLHQQEDAHKHFQKAVSLTAKRYPRGAEVSLYDYYTLLCFHLILLGFFVCQGDVSQWYVCFQKCHELIGRCGGLWALCKEFGYSNDIKFLASNFYYHDILSSSAFVNGPIIPATEYAEVFSHGFFDSSYGIDPLQGCLNPVYMLLAEEHEMKVALRARRQRLDEMLNNEMSGEEDPTVLTEFNHMRVEYLEFCEEVVDNVMMKIDNCQIDESMFHNSSPEEIALHKQIFALYRLVCKLNWVLHLKGSPPCSNELQLILVRIMEAIDRLIDTNMLIVLCFPLLMAGTTCYTKHDRQRMEINFASAIRKCPIRNVKRAWDLVQETWRRNPDGEVYVDWADICEDFGWQLCVC